jgi:hypothetical protein
MRSIVDHLPDRLSFLLKEETRLRGSIEGLSLELGGVLGEMQELILELTEGMDDESADFLIKEIIEFRSRKQSLVMFNKVGKGFSKEPANG